MTADLARTIRSLRFKSKPLRAPVVALRHLGLREHDVFLACYPRSGSTWLRFILAELLTETPAEFKTVNAQIPYVGRHPNAPPSLPGKGRLIGTHELRLPPGKRAIYLIRDPRDVAPSYYQWQLRHGVFSGAFSDFLPSFLSGASNPFPAWDTHVRRWLSPPEEGVQTLLVRFEDLRRDCVRQVESVLLFLGLNIKTSRIEQAIANNTVGEMRLKENRASSRDFVERAITREIPFVGRGVVGGWKDKLSEAEANRIEERFFEGMSAVGYLPALRVK